MHGYKLGVDTFHECSYRNSSCETEKKLAIKMLGDNIEKKSMEKNQ